MRIIGIDPGNNCGVCIMDIDDSARTVVTKLGTIHSKSYSPLYNFLIDLKLNSKNLISVEQPMGPFNSIIHNQYRMHGIVFLAAEVSKATVSTVMPQEWKKKCLGNGHLKKESVANFFKSIYKQSKYGQDAIDSFFICQYKLLEQYGAKANKFNYVFI